MQVFLHNSFKLNHFASILYIFSSFLLIIFALNARACEDFFFDFFFPPNKVFASLTAVLIIFVG